MSKSLSVERENEESFERKKIRLLMDAMGIVGYQRERDMAN